MQTSHNPTSHRQVKPSLLHLSVVTAVCWFCLSYMAVAKSVKAKPEQFPVNPLEITTPDPLLPQSPKQQPLSPQESQALTVALDGLDAEAAAKLKAGDKVGGFEIWNRELRLRRALGPSAEVESLGRVGAIAWSQNQKTEVRIITERLRAIQLQTSKSQQVDFQLLQSLALAYQQVRALQPAIALYQQILTVQRQQQPAAVETTLQTLAELNLSWFDYPSAAANYEELLRLARAEGERVSEATYLQQLAYIYDQAKQPQQAVKVKQQLLELDQKQDFTEVPALQMAIASDYEVLGQPEQAFQNYQAAYKSAWALQQYYRAGDALRKLIELYRSRRQTSAALEASQILLDADHLADNAYGMMNTYDQIGQIQTEAGNYSEALAAFQKGLEIAKQLQYQEKYFAQQIEQVNQKLSHRKT